MTKFNIQHGIYKNILRPIIFNFDAEKVHNLTTNFGESIENMEWLLETLYSYKNEKPKKSLLGIDFDNPIGLGAGFDYDGHLTKTMKHLGFGFNTVGTVSAKPYEGNKPPRMTRLIKSKSILVNKGFKSDGAAVIAKRLDQKNLKNHNVGISIGNSNIPSVNTLSKAIDDYLFTFGLFNKRKYVRYFELNISCPNIIIRESFKSMENIKRLIKEINKLKVKKPIFMKMHNEIEFEESDKIVKTCLDSGIQGFIFANLIGNRQNIALNKSEVSDIKELKGGLSGKPTFDGSNRLIAHTRQKFGKNVVIIGSGGIFNAQDALVKFKNGADLIQIVTGLIFEGPQIAGDINSQLIKNKFYLDR